MGATGNVRVVDFVLDNLQCVSAIDIVLILIGTVG